MPTDMDIMHTFIPERQVAAYGSAVDDAHDAVMSEHRQAMVCQDIEDAALMGIFVVQYISRALDCRRKKGPIEPESRDAFAEACRRMLGRMVRMRKLIEMMRRRGYEIGCAGDFGEAVVDLRDALASLLESQPIEAIPQPSYEEVVSSGRGQYPPQSWFDEDVSRLGGITR